jgi:hypothetical protein
VLPGNSATQRLPNTRPPSSIGSFGSSGVTRDKGNSVASDSVSISGPAAVLSQLSAQHAQRLAGLAASVRGGTYEPSSSAIDGANSHAGDRVKGLAISPDLAREALRGIDI